MLKVCHIISGYQRTDARVFQRQCKSLKSHGIEVTILTNDCGLDEYIDGIKFIVCKKKWQSRFKILFFAKYQFYKEALKIDADIYQLHSPELLSLGVLLKNRDKIVIYDAHEDLPNHILEKEWLPTIIRKPLSFLVKSYMNYILKFYDFIITPHSHVVNSLKKINFNTILIANFPIIQNRKFVSLDEFVSREKKICYTGTVYSYSNQEIIIDAIKDINNISYEIAGHFDNIHYQTLMKQQGFDKVKFHGRLSWEKINAFYDNMLIGLVIYDYKYNLGYKLGSFGTNKLFEYMESGLPFICTDYLLWKKIIDKYKCGIYVQPRNLTQIKEAITYLLDNPEIAYKMGRNGRNAVLREFNWNTQENIYLNIFNKIKNSKSSCFL